MTKEEAVKWLKAIEKKYIHGGDEEFDERRKEALHMAIEALKEQQIKQELSNLKCSSCRFKMFDAFSYPCIDCGKAFSHYEIVT